MSSLESKICTLLFTDKIIQTLYFKNECRFVFQSAEQILYDNIKGAHKITANVLFVLNYRLRSLGNCNKMYKFVQ